MEGPRHGGAGGRQGEQRRAATPRGAARPPGGKRDSRLRPREPGQDRRAGRNRRRRGRAAARTAGGSKMSTQTDTEHLRARLEDERRKVLAAIAYLQKENPGAIEDITGDLALGPGDNHLADLATDTIDREIDDTLEENSGRVLREIDAALKRIDEGTYGTCTAG